MIFRFKDSDSNIEDVELSDKFVMEYIEDIAFEKLSECNCEPIGETNVVECNCYEKYEDFVIDEIVK